MVFGDDLKGELSGRIGASQSGDTFGQLEEGRKEIEQGNTEKAMQIFNAIIAQTDQSSTQLLSQKQHRAAAEEFYYQALSYEYMGKQDERRISLSKTVDALQNASHTAINFGEDKRGITTLTLAGLVALLYGDETTAHATYNQGISISDQKQNSEALKKLLYSLGYLLDAVKNTSMSAVTEAQGYLANDLKPMLNSSKLTTFNSLLDGIVGQVSTMIESKVKMPKIEVTTQVPKDLLFDDQYEILIKIENVGEGEATNLRLELNLPSDLTIISGEAVKDLDKLGTMATIEEKISFKMSGEGRSQAKSEISGNLTFTDMLANNRKHVISPMELEFRSVSKGSEYDLLIENSMSNLIIDGLHEQLPTTIIEDIKKLTEQVKVSVKASIDSQQYEQADVGLDILNTLVTWSNDTLKGNTPEPRLAVEISKLLYNREQKITETLTTQFKNEQEKAIQDKTETIKREFEIEKQRMVEEKAFELEHQLKEAETKFKDETAKLISEHNNSVQDLASRHEFEKEQVLADHTSKLQTEFEAEKSKHAEHHEAEMGKLTRSIESKMRLEITQLESKLKEEANLEIQKKNNEVENAIRELQDQNINELETQSQKLRDELNSKYKIEIDELKGQLANQEDRLVGHATEEKESALKALENKLKQESATEIENLRREMKDSYDFNQSEKISQIKQQYEKESQEKDMKIRELQEKISILENPGN
ncbi:MAG: hypothetical protein GPJ54_09110 [Candidatus Heimdallarchaeota archaeon]|nr:hypothetical protein [Candidatus Heimdallarchaeota archaeon]